jgi:hypothetical protein
LFDKDFYYKKWTSVGEKKTGKTGDDCKNEWRTPSKNPEGNPEDIPKSPSRSPGKDFPKSMDKRNSDFSGGGGTGRQKLAKNPEAFSFSEKINSQTREAELEPEPQGQAEAQKKESPVGRPPKGCLAKIKDIFVCKRPGKLPPLKNSR